jgi:hypothetical protein
VRTRAFLAAAALIAGGLTTVVDGIAGAQSKPAPPVVSTQKFLCEQTYMNFAWGFQSSGLYIDADGGVYAFTPQRGKGNEPETLSEEELTARYATGRRLLRTLPAAQVAEMAALIPQTAKGPYSPRKQEGADMGGKVTSCYVFEATSQRYRPIMLTTTGDWSNRNLSPAAARLANWVESAPIAK